MKILSTWEKKPKLPFRRWVYKRSENNLKKGVGRRVAKEVIRDLKLRHKTLAKHVNNKRWP